jgi:hypothetical protein
VSSSYPRSARVGRPKRRLAVRRGLLTRRVLLLYQVAFGRRQDTAIE